MGERVAKLLRYNAEVFLKAILDFLLKKEDWIPFLLKNLFMCIIAMCKNSNRKRVIFKSISLRNVLKNHHLRKKESHTLYAVVSTMGM